MVAKLPAILWVQHVGSVRFHDADGAPSTKSTPGPSSSSSKEPVQPTRMTVDATGEVHPASTSSLLEASQEATEKGPEEAKAPEDAAPETRLSTRKR